VDKLGAGSNPENLRGIDLDYELLKLDLSEEGVDLGATTAPVNFASETHVDRSIADPRSFVTNNVWETFNLLESARRTNEGVRIVHVATDEVYGEALEDSLVVYYGDSQRVRAGAREVRQLQAREVAPGGRRGKR